MSRGYRVAGSRGLDNKKGEGNKIENSDAVQTRHSEFVGAYGNAGSAGQVYGYGNKNLKLSTETKRKSAHREKDLDR